MKVSKSVLSGGKPGLKPIMSQTGDFETHADTNDFNFNKSRFSAKSMRVPPAIGEVVESSMKLYFNKANPKFGMKHYEIHDNMQKEPYF
jgi:hypothetical protein